MITLTVHVTPDKIAQGVPRKCSLCPVALAVKEAFKVSGKFTDRQIESVTAGRGVIGYLNEHDELRSATLLIAGTRFILAYDETNGQHTSINPFSFELEIYDSV